MKNSTLPSVSICIPAYNEEKNIGKLLRSIPSQKHTTFVLKEIIVYCDASTDTTIQICTSIHNRLLRCIVGKKQVGNLQAIQKLLHESSGEIVVLLDADIAFYSTDTLDQLIASFNQDTNIGLVGGNPIPDKAHTFIEEAIHTNIRSYRNISANLRNGSNPYNCHGAILALSRAFIRKLYFPKEIFSGDTYMYFSCLFFQFKFAYAQNARVIFHTADNLHDALIQYGRFLEMDDYSKKKFSHLLESEYAIPLVLKLRYLGLDCIFHAPQVLCMWFIKTYSKRSRLSKKMNNGIWETAASTKKAIINE